MFLKSRVKKLFLAQGFFLIQKNHILGIRFIFLTQFDFFISAYKALY